MPSCHFPITLPCNRKTVGQFLHRRRHRQLGFRNHTQRGGGGGGKRLMEDLSPTSPPTQPPKWLLHVDGRIIYPPVSLLIVILLVFLYCYISWILSDKSLRLNETSAAPAPPAAPAVRGNASGPSAAPLPPAVEFSAEERRECAVCLGELRDGEKGRLLPRCGHGFHVECIDAWLRSHSTCPVCRSPASAAAPEEAA